jgi:hypothetical protein
VGFDDPLDLLRRLKLGREEYCQRLLTMLIVGGPYPRWNSRNAVSPNGTRFLWELDVLCFGDPSWPAPPVFVDEFELPRRHEDEAGAGPDYALLWDDRLWMIELKTEATSHRPAQLPAYLELAAHHHPGRRIDLCYLTPALLFDPPVLREGARFAHITWDRTIPLLRATWSDATAAEQRVLAALLAALDGIGGSWTTWRTERLVEPAAETPSTIEEVPDALDEALDLAWLTATDGQQRALNRTAGHLEDLQALRLAVRQAICDASDERLRHVGPWIWSVATSTGKALTTSGYETGYELRLSRYRNAFLWRRLDPGGGRT